MTSGFGSSGVTWRTKSEAEGVCATLEDCL
jgi:hypothetical protein